MTLRLEECRELQRRLSWGDRATAPEYRLASVTVNEIKAKINPGSSPIPLYLQHLRNGWR